MLKRLKIKTISIIIIIYGKKRWIERAYKLFFKRNIVWNQPKTFNEKMQYFKLFDKKIEFTNYADKFLVRSYVKDVVGENILIPVLHCLSKQQVRDFDFSILQNSCVIKGTHGSGWVDIIRERNITDVDWKLKKEMYMSWMSMNYYNYSFEPQYKRLLPGLIIEELLLEQDALPADIKVHCFNGVPTFIHVATDREGESGRAFYDTEWKRMPFHWTPIDKKGKEKKVISQDLMRPSNLLEILEVSQKLSALFQYVRVDLYNVNNKIYFGELTFHPGSGFDVFIPSNFDIVFGDKLDINQRSIII